MYQQEWEPGDAMRQFERARRKGKVRRALQGGAFLLSWPVVATLNLGLQERIVIGFLVLLAWAAWFVLAYPRAVRRMAGGGRQTARLTHYQKGRDGQWRPVGELAHYQRNQGRQGQHNYPPGQNQRPAPQSQQHRQGQPFQRNYPHDQNQRPAPQGQGYRRNQGQQFQGIQGHRGQQVQRNYPPGQNQSPTPQGQQHRQGQQFQGERQPEEG